MADTPTYGVMAEFTSAGALLRAADRAYRDGYRKLDAFSPFPVHGLAEAMGHHDKTVQKAVLGGGIAGAFGGFGLCMWTATTEGIGGIMSGYALNIGGRPLVSWPAFIIPTFETTILCAAITAVAQHDRAQRVAAAVPPGVQRRAVSPARHAGRVLPVHRGGRREVRRWRRRGSSWPALGATEVNDVAH